LFMDDAHCADGRAGVEDMRKGGDGLYEIRWLWRSPD
jgi:hypothetical protein